jgi:hypothetical protein
MSPSQSVPVRPGQSGTGSGESVRRPPLGGRTDSRPDSSHGKDSKGRVGPDLKRASEFRARSGPPANGERRTALDPAVRAVRKLTALRPTANSGNGVCRSLPFAVRALEGIVGDPWEEVLSRAFGKRGGWVATSSLWDVLASRGGAMRFGADGADGADGSRATRIVMTNVNYTRDGREG